MTCPHCLSSPPLCPVCGSPMLNRDRVMSPTMGQSGSRIIGHKWTCSQSDEAGTAHYVELSYPHKDTP
jgi:hypothetical protein